MKQRDIGFIQGMACAIKIVHYNDGVYAAAGLLANTNMPLSEFEKFADKSDLEAIREAAAVNGGVAKNNF